MSQFYRQDPVARSPRIAESGRIAPVEAIGESMRSTSMTKTCARGFLLGLCIFALALAAQAQQQVLEVITLGYRQAEEVIPMLRPLLAPGGTLTGMNNRLVVRTTPANLAEIKQVLGAVDSQAPAADDFGAPELGWRMRRETLRRFRARSALATMRRSTCQGRQAPAMIPA